MRISDWSSDVCSSDLVRRRRLDRRGQIQDDRLVGGRLEDIHHRGAAFDAEIQFGGRKGFRAIFETPVGAGQARGIVAKLLGSVDGNLFRSEEHTSELQSLMRISYAVFCLKKKNTAKHNRQT